MKKKKLLVILGITAMLLTGCGGQATSDKSSNNSYQESPEIITSDDDYSYEACEAPNASYDSSSSASNSDSQSSSGSGQAATASSSDYSQKLIKSYDFEFETKTLDDTISAIQKKVTECNGYIEDSSLHGSDSRYANYTIRIPKDRVADFLSSTDGFGEQLSYSESATDITMSYYDTKTHIETLETKHQRLLELLEKAEKLEDIITLEDEISAVEYELNSYQTELKVYDNQVEYATITMYVKEVSQISITEEDSYWQKIAKGFKSSLSALGDMIRGILYGLIIMSPFIIILTAIVVPIVILTRRSAKKKKAQGQLQQNVTANNTINTNQK